MAPIPDSGATPEPAPTTHLTLEQSWDEAPGMAGLAAVFEQDMDNLPLVQAGLKSMGKTTVTYGQYQEGRIRRWHRLIDHYIERGLARDGQTSAQLDAHRVFEPLDVRPAQNQS